MTMRLVRWDPFRELSSLHSDVTRALAGIRESNGDTGGGRWAPSADIWETDAELVYAFDLPGVPEDEISVELDDNALTVSGERERSQEVSKEGFYRYERSFGSFSRTVALPPGVDEDAVQAEYRNGVLEVHVPKPEEAKPRRIEVGAGQRTIEGKASKS